MNLEVAFTLLLYLSVAMNSTLAFLLPADKSFKSTLPIPSVTCPGNTLPSTVTLTSPVALFVILITATALPG